MVVSASYARSDAERFERAINKINKKTYCLCRADQKVGRVRIEPSVGGVTFEYAAFCVAPIFAAGGASSASAVCSDFDVIGP